MKPVDQTILDPVKGNCFEASIASILEIPLEDIPDFYADEDVDWLSACNKWLHAYGFFALGINVQSEKINREELKHITDNVMCEAAVNSPRYSGVKHSIVFYKGVVLHDPHPSKDSMDCKLDDLLSIIIFIAIDPAKTLSNT